MREREDENRTREAGNRDEVEGVVANTLDSFRNGAVGFIVWLDRLLAHSGSNSAKTSQKTRNKTQESSTPIRKRAAVDEKVRSARRLSLPNRKKMIVRGVQPAHIGYGDPRLCQA